MTEAEWRSATSRAYYTAFHVARQLLEQCGFTVPRADQAHTYLSARLANSGHPDVSNAGHDLNPLRRMRHWADDDLHTPIGHGVAFGYVQLAEPIIDLLESVQAEAGIRSQITNAMRIYERDVLLQVTWHP